LEPEDVMAWSNRGNSLRSLQRFEEALDSYRKALNLDPDDFAARVGSGACLAECGQADEGIAALEKAVEETGHPLVLFELATVLAKTDRHEAAVSMYDSLITADFVSAPLWNNRGECLARLGQLEAALESFDRSIEMNAQFAPAWFGKARTLVNAERVEEARPLARRYWEIADEAERKQSSVLAMLSLCGIEH
jgi:tetratricopeptide (TPR) repeat protein